MKKIIYIFMLVSIFTSLCVVHAATSIYSEIELILLQTVGEKIEKEYKGTTSISVDKISTSTLNFKFDTPPVIFEDRTLVPVRAITESLGASVGWFPSERKVSVVKGQTNILLYIDNKQVMVNNTEKAIDVPAKIFNNRTYVPLRFIMEEFGLEVDYNEKTGLITIDNPIGGENN